MIFSSLLAWHAHFSYYNVCSYLIHIFIIKQNLYFLLFKMDFWIIILIRERYIIINITETVSKASFLESMYLLTNGRISCQAKNRTSGEIIDQIFG